MACCEYGSRNLEMATIGVEKGAKWIGDCLNVYKEKKFVREDGTFNMIPLPMVIKQILQEKGYKLVDITDESMKENKRFSADEIPVLPMIFLVQSLLMTIKFIVQSARKYSSVCRNMGE